MVLELENIGSGLGPWTHVHNPITHCVGLAGKTLDTCTLEHVHSFLGMWPSQ